MRWMRTTGTMAALLAGALVLAAAPGAQAAGTVIYHTGPDVFEVAPIGVDVAKDAVDIMIQQGIIGEADRESEITALTPDLTTLKLGYQCQIFGLFYAYFAWWSCDMVFYKWTSSDTFEYMPVDLAKFEAHMKTQSSDAEELAAQLAIHKAVIAAMEKKAGGKKLADAYPLSSIKMEFWKKNGRWVIGGVLLLVIVFGALKMTVLKKKAPPPPAGGFPPPANYPPPAGMPPANYPPPGPPPGT